MAFLIEVVVNRGVDGGGEFLQRSQLPEAEHRTLPSSKRQVGIFSAVVHQNRTVSWLISMPRSCKILDVAERQREPDAQHHGQTDDLVLCSIPVPGSWKPLPAGSGVGWKRLQHLRQRHLRPMPLGHNLHQMTEERPISAAYHP